MTAASVPAVTLPHRARARLSLLLPLAALLALGLLLVPYAGLVATTPWRNLQTAPGDWDAIETSLVYTLVAMVIVVLGGTPLAWWMARARLRARWLVDLALLVPLLTPPLALGLLLAMIYGPYSAIGQAAEAVGVSLTNTRAAFVLAQVYASAPYFIIAARAAFEAVPGELEDVSLTLGRGRWQTFWRVSLPLAGLGLASGLAIAWVRALGEFGAVLVVAYFPHGIPVQLWVDLQDVGLKAVYPVLWLFFLIGLPLPMLLGALARRPQPQ